MFLLCFFTLSAQAYVYIGNPPLTVEVVRDEGDLVSGSALVVGVRVHTCSGGYTDYVVDQTVDPTEPQTLTITGGDLCAVTVGWGSDVTVASSAFELRYEEAYTTVELTGAAHDETPLVPYVVDSGTFSGSKPDLRVTIGN